MTRQAALDTLPADAEWSCSFGYPGQEGCTEYYRCADGRQFQVKKISQYPETWSVKEMPR